MSADPAVESSAPDISICVPVYRRHGPPNVATLHASLERALDGLRGELVVALNGISARAAGAPGDSELVELEHNHGVAVGWNRAADRARAPLLCFANDDAVLGAGSLRRLREALSARPDAGVVGPAGVRFDMRRGRPVARVDSPDLAPGELRECDAVVGLLMATPREVFDAIGGFDEAYSPCLFEDIDYCVAARRRAGRRCYVVGGVDYAHRGGVSGARPWRRVEFDGRRRSIHAIGRRNNRYFRAKWGGA